MNKNLINPVVYSAAEHTFLAWIRTAVAFLGFGVAIEKFQIKSFSKIYHLRKFLLFIGIITLLLDKINFCNQYITSKKLYLFYVILITLITSGLLFSFLFI